MAARPIVPLLRRLTPQRRRFEGGTAPRAPKDAPEPSPRELQKPLGLKRTGLKVIVLLSKH